MPLPFTLSGGRRAESKCAASRRPAPFDRGALRAPPLRATGALIVLLLSTPAFAQLETSPDGGAGVPSEEVPITDPVPAEEAPPAFTHKVEVNGYLNSRTGYGRSRWSGIIPTTDIPQWTQMIEANVQLKVTYHPNGFVYTDTSGIGLFGFDYRSIDPAGMERTDFTRDSPSARPLMSINELYLLHEVTPWLNFMLGKKRIVWGAGQAFNPTDLLNIRKDPTDPTFQRAGAWLARIEVPLETSAFTLLFAPGVTQSAFGIPYGFIEYPKWDKQDNEAHYLVGARAYFLLFNTDVNVMAYFSNKYNDEFRNKVRAGASLSRIFFDTWEVHVEGLLEQGSDRVYVEHGCVTDVAAAVACNAQMTPFAGRFRLGDPTWLPRILGGIRKQFDDDSFLSVEYLFQADGYRPDQWQDVVSAFDGVAQARAAGFPIPPEAALIVPAQTDSSGSASATPARFNFVPTAKHYAFITFNKPRIKDDFTVQLVLLMNLQDLSTLWTPSVIWSATEWLQLSLVGFVPVPGPNGLAAKLPSSGKYVTEYGSFPQLFRVFFELRLFY